MKRTTAPGAVGGKHVDRVQGVTVGSRRTAEDSNNLQEEICNPIEAIGLALDGADQRQLERAIIGLRHAVNDFVFGGNEITPVTVAGSRSNLHPEYPEYNPCIPRYDANHDVSAVEVGQDIVDYFRGLKGRYKGVTDFAVTCVGSEVTLPTSVASQAAIRSFLSEAEAAGFVNGGQPASFSPDFTTEATKQCITIAGVEYVVAAVNPTNYKLTTVGNPASGTASVHPFRIAGQPTKFRLPRLSGFVPAAANDDDGQYSLNKRCMDRLELHLHAFAANGSGGSSNTVSSAINNNATAGAYQTGTPIGDGTNTLRTGKTTDPRAFGTFIGTWVRKLLATSWTSA